MGSATDLRAAVGAQDASYDAVFEFGIIHHVEDWRAALAEIARVLRPGGRFFFEEVTATALARPSYRALFDHPDRDRFTAGEFLAECGRQGLTVGERWVTRVGGDYLFGKPRYPASRSTDPPGLAGLRHTTARVQQAAHRIAPPRARERCWTGEGVARCPGYLPAGVCCGVHRPHGQATATRTAAKSPRPSAAAGWTSHVPPMDLTCT